jgi:hypothetical protein
MYFLFHRKILTFRQDNQKNNSHYSLKPMIAEPQNQFDLTNRSKTDLKNKIT